ncbi:ATP-binding protein [Rheinheimera texasensis]|uniref:sensor histidine kinase n=1 Tax=Rheinheimera texasensis TaxID=306205 RepID=UPI0032B11F53
MALLPLKPGRSGLYLGAALLLGGFALLLWYALPQHYVVFAGYAALVLLLLLWLLLRSYLRQLDTEVMALNLQADSLRDQSFNLTANRAVLRELTPLAEALNQMSAELAQQRATLYQRELLLDTVLQTNPSALILTDEQGRVLFSNPAARHLLSGGRRFDGSYFSAVLADWPELLKACQAGAQGLIHAGDAQNVWHLSVSPFRLNQREHLLYQLKPMTREFKQEEIKAWKKLIRVIGHELNNSLAPMSSLAFSGARLVKKPDFSAADQAQLAQMFAVIGERATQLNQFLQAYLNFAKLPPPQPSLVHFASLINNLQNQYEFELLGDLPRSEWFLDSAQLTQLLLNLLKNAGEAGASIAGTTLSFRELPHQLVLELQDDGGGLSAEVLQHALVPFYTTKPQGSGIGLTLCRDIMESHGGSLELFNQSAGLLVRLTFPRIAATSLPGI